MYANKLYYSADVFNYNLFLCKNIRLNPSSEISQGHSEVAETRLSYDTEDPGTKFSTRPRSNLDGNFQVDTTRLKLP